MIYFFIFLQLSGKVYNLIFLSPHLSKPTPTHPILAVSRAIMQHGGTGEEMEGSVSTRGPARDPAIAGQLWHRHQLDGVLRPGLQCSWRGEMLHKARKARYKC